MYKLIAIDLDGTLLNSYGEVSDENKKTILKAKEKGVKIVLTSGRPNSAMENFAYDVGADEYMISGNGAVIYDLKNKETIYNNYLDKDKVLEIINVCEENSMYYNVYTEECIITKSLNYNTLFYHSENQKKPPEKWTKIIITDNVIDYVKELKTSAFLKITVCDNDRTIFQRMLATLKKDDEIDVIDISHMSKKIVKSQGQIIPLEYYYTEITNKNVDKWNAINFLIKKLCISKDEVLTIGDNINDEKMIENAGLGIAMENGSSKLKQMANDITDDNNKDGVAKAIEKYINL